MSEKALTEVIRAAAVQLAVKNGVKTARAALSATSVELGGDNGKRSPIRKQNMMDIARPIMDEYGVTYLQMRGPNRSLALVIPRHKIMRALREDGGYPWTRIGAFLDRDHSTCMHGARSAQRREAALDTGPKTTI